MQLKFKNTDIHYSTFGKGKAVVLLHGFLESMQIWKEYVPIFSEQGQIITIDLPGHGRSDCLEDIHSMESMAEVVFAVLSELKVDKTDLIGHSMGGYVALAFLEAHPEMVGSIMLLNATPTADTTQRKETRDRSIRLVRKNKAAYINMAISNLLAPTASTKHQAAIEALKDRAAKFPTKGIIYNLEGMKIRTDRTAILKRFSGGKFIVAGTDDPLLDYQEIRALAKHTDCTFIGLPGGHLSYIESKEKFLKLCISSKI